MSADLTQPHFTDETEARKFLEATRWPNGPICPHCGTVGKAYPCKREGVWRCASAGCRMDFTVMVGTVFERSHIPLHKWLLASHLMAASKKGVSAHQLHRMLGLTYKSAWFMAHRLREAMRDDSPAPLGGEGQVVEADETFIGPAKWVYSNDRGWYQANTVDHKRKVLTLVERRGRARSFHVDSLKSEHVGRILRQNVSTESRLHTDEAQHYKSIGPEFAAHERVNHSEKEYARGDVTTNTVEGFFSIFKRGMKGVYHHCGEQHLQRYLHEFDFRYSNRSALGVSDSQRATRLLKGIEGRRLTYRGPDKRQARA
jgi:ISXO2 transposase-like protein/transposase-like zinc ribbon protein